jgi:hypothetical protein
MDDVPLLADEHGTLRVDHVPAHAAAPAAAAEKRRRPKRAPQASALND